MPQTKKQTFKGYCVKCSATRNIINHSLQRTANNKPYVRGKCEKCSCTVCRFLPKQPKQN